MDVQKEKIRVMVKGFYDLQELRIATGNRIVASMRPAEFASANNEKYETPEDAKKAADEEQKKVDSILTTIFKEYDKVTDYFVEQFQSRGSVQKAIDVFGSELAYIKNRVDYDMVTSYGHLMSAEDGFKKSLEREVEQHPMWDAFFKNVGGCGPLMSAVCIAYLDPYKARHCSSFWKYAGLDVLYDEKVGEMVGRRKWHTEQREYTDKDGEVKTKIGLTYNPFLKTKLVGVLGSGFLRARGGSKYGDIYRDYRNRLENREIPEGGKKLQPIVIHRRATRYAVKMFLRDMWTTWRQLEGLPVSQPYEEVFLNAEPHHSPRNIPTSEPMRMSQLKLNLD